MLTHASLRHSRLAVEPCAVGTVGSSRCLRLQLHLPLFRAEWDVIAHAPVQLILLDLSRAGSPLQRSPCKLVEASGSTSRSTRGKRCFCDAWWYCMRLDVPRLITQTFLVSELQSCRCSKLPAKLQGYIMPDRKPQKAPSAKQQAAAPCSASQPKGAKMLFFNKPCCATSVRKLTIKLGGSALASHQASIPPPQPKPSLRLKLKSPLTRPATHTADPPPSLPLAQSQKQTLPNAKRFKPAPVERPVTRHFKRQQTTKSKVHLRLRPPAQSAVTQRKSTLTHQQKRHGPNIIRSTGQAEQRSRSQDTHLLTACTQSLPGGAAAAVHQSDMGHAPAAGWAAGLAGASEAGHSHVKPAPMLSTMTTCVFNAAGAADATAADGLGKTAAAEAAAAAEADTAHRPAQVALLKKGAGDVVPSLWSSHHSRACGLLNDIGTHRWGLSQQLFALNDISYC